MRAGLWTGFFLNEKRDSCVGTVVNEVSRLRNAGFECGELDERNAYSLFVLPDRKTALENMDILAGLGFFSQIHSPKPVDDVESLILCEDRIIEACSVMKVKTVVTHPFIATTVQDEPKVRSTEYLKRFSDKAYGKGVFVALENQIYPVDMDCYLSECPFLGVNIDFAHAIACSKDVVSMIDEYSSRLYGLHVSDSDGRPEDWHIMPGSGIIDWKDVVHHLQKAGYSGDFHLEIVHERSCNPSENDITVKKAFETVKRILSEAVNG